MPDSDPSRAQQSPVVVKFKSPGGLQLAVLTGQDDRQQQQGSVRLPPGAAQPSQPQSAPGLGGGRPVEPHWPAGAASGAPGPWGGRERRLDLQCEPGEGGHRQHQPRPQCYQGDQDGQKSWHTGNGIKIYFLIPHNSL